MHFVIRRSRQARIARVAGGVCNIKLPRARSPRSRNACAQRICTSTMCAFEIGKCSVMPHSSSLIEWCLMINTISRCMRASIITPLNAARAWRDPPSSLSRWTSVSIFPWKRYNRDRAGSDNYLESVTCRSFMLPVLFPLARSIYLAAISNARLNFAPYFPLIAHFTQHGYSGKRKGTKRKRGREGGEIQSYSRCEQLMFNALCLSSC